MADAVQTKSNDGIESSERGAKQEECKFTIYVELWTSKVLRLKVMGSNSIDDIKELMTSVEGTPKDRQILKFEGQELEDHQTLEHYNIKNGASLDQRVRRYKLGIVR